MTKQKVFCVGFQKTGTTSLGMALEELGYKVGGYFDFRHLAKNLDLDISQLKKEIIENARKYDAVKDTPYPIFYEELDKEFPNSKFILVVRNADSWLRSVINDFGDHDNAIHRLIYKSAHPSGNEGDWVSRYNQHNSDVIAYFSGNPDRLLVLDISKGEVSWKPICDFLGLPVPDRPWPHANSKTKKMLKMRYWKLQNKLRLRND